MRSLRVSVHHRRASGEDPNVKTLTTLKNGLRECLLPRVAEGRRHRHSFKRPAGLSDLRLTWSLPGAQVPEDVSGGGRGQSPVRLWSRLSPQRSWASRPRQELTVRAGAASPAPPAAVSSAPGSR